MPNKLSYYIIIPFVFVAGCSDRMITLCNNTGNSIIFHLNGEKHCIADGEYWEGKYISNTGKMHIEWNKIQRAYPIIYPPPTRSLHFPYVGIYYDFQIEPNGKIYMIRRRNAKKIKPEDVREHPQSAYVGDKLHEMGFPLNPISE